MGMLENFKKNKKEREDELINWLYDRIDQLSGQQLTELLKYVFIAFGDPAAGMYLIRLLIKKINRHIGSEFEPRDKAGFEKWLYDVFGKTDVKTKRAIFVTAAFDIYMHNVVSAANIMHKIDEALAELRNTPEFNALGEKNDGA